MNAKNRIDFDEKPARVDVVAKPEKIEAVVQPPDVVAREPKTTCVVSARRVLLPNGLIARKGDEFDPSEVKMEYPRYRQLVEGKAIIGNDEVRTKLETSWQNKSKKKSPDKTHKYTSKDLG